MYMSAWQEFELNLVIDERNLLIKNGYQFCMVAEKETLNEVTLTILCFPRI